MLEIRVFVAFPLVFALCASLPSWEYLTKTNANITSSAVALILARGGSKGIPLKNLAQIRNLSLIARTISILRNADIFKEIWVSTDHVQIEIEAHGAMVHFRSEATATDQTSSIESVHEFLNAHPVVNSIALIQCTSVFLREEYLIKAASIFPQFDCVFSVVRSFKLRWNYDASAHRLLPLNFVCTNRPRRQDWNGELLESGMFYFAKKDLLLKGAFQNDKCHFVEIDPADGLEIDSYDDLKLANLLASNE